MISRTVPSPIGPLLLTADHGSLTGLTFVGSWSAGAPPAGGPTPGAGQQASDGTGDPLLDAATAQLAEYFAGSRSAFDLPLHPIGDDFQRAVWQAIAEIPYGTTVSYGSIARRLGGVGLSQAVGAATGRNPIAVVIGCHRVVGADGSLTGFGGGLDRKRFLLALEESAETKASRLF